MINATLMYCEIDILCWCGKRFTAWGNDDGIIEGKCDCGCYLDGSFSISMHDSLCESEGGS